LGQRLAILAQLARIAGHALRQRQVQVPSASFRRALDDLGHLRYKYDRIEMPDDFCQRTLDAIQQNFLTQALAGAPTASNTSRTSSLCFAGPRTYSATNRPTARGLAGLDEIDQLPVGMGQEGGEGRQEINGFQHTGLALGIVPVSKTTRRGMFISRRAKLRKLVNERCVKYIARSHVQLWILRFWASKPW